LASCSETCSLHFPRLCPAAPGWGFLRSQPALPAGPLLDLFFTPVALFFSPGTDPGYLPLYLFLARSLFLGRRQPGMLILIVLVTLNLLACAEPDPERKEDYRAAARLVAEQSYLET
jgi:hypothetical protein